MTEKLINKKLQKPSPGNMEMDIQNSNVKKYDMEELHFQISDVPVPS